MTGEYFRFLLFNSFEVIAVLIFIMGSFRIPIKWYVKEIIFLAVLMPTISYFQINSDYAGYNTLVQFSILVISFKVLFEENWISSFWRTALGYTIYLMIQTIVALIAVYTDFTTLEEVAVPFTPHGEILQTLSAFTALCIAGFKIFSGDYFSFSFRKINKSKTVYVIVLIFGIASEIFALKFLIFSQNSFNFIVYTILIFIIFILFIYLSIKRERDERTEVVTRIRSALKKEKEVNSK
ncbi:hypothetical protein [Paenibacillus medicaginis]|uniref:Uncharacterized protein n=1 Tax=Paenibacillus medicaginis TaxID=1470560 RepID=A0ABV5BY92_9BACL